MNLQPVCSSPHTCTPSALCWTPKHHTDRFKARKIPNCQSAACAGCCAARRIKPLMFSIILFFHCLVVVNESAILQLMVMFLIGAGFVALHKQFWNRGEILNILTSNYGFYRSICNYFSIVSLSDHIDQIIH